MTRICRALNPEASDGTPQVIYYEAGIGTESTVWNHFVGGATGMGIAIPTASQIVLLIVSSGMSENIRMGYDFLAMNYEEGDEIFLLGFSRGAFTARSIAGLISAVGLMTRKGMVDFFPVFKDWENQLHYKDYKTRWPEQPFPNRPVITDPAYPQKLKDVRDPTPQHLSPRFSC